MIIWVNGAFGSGKTQTAYELNRRIPRSYVFDPENAGYYIRKNIPREASTEDDFQHYPMWREINYVMLTHICSSYEGTVIVPMTVVNPQYFDELVGRLRRDGRTVNHFALCASMEMLLKRLRSRGEGSGSWAARQIDRCLSGLSDDVFRRHLDTENMSVADVAETIAGLSNIGLGPPTKGKLLQKIERIKTQIKHIRFFQ
ncbi:AAA family ATPase [Paenibacillus contaminans]|uniref:Tunicamycin resistance protein n=1 Tax=Paenibacillus contaminans TaxID=450362 RepID=A0A329MQR3_9BACL|nr:AAA family ATPase [Paenibacillus contaminans]RAV21892.1 tunicamycin resistance protein [Paenibacillus contaminans]